jgi:hypothetical protein
VLETKALDAWDDPRRTYINSKYRLPSRINKSITELRRTLNPYCLYIVAQKKFFERVIPRVPVPQNPMEISDPVSIIFSVRGKRTSRVVDRCDVSDMTLRDALLLCGVDPTRGSTILGGRKLTNTNLELKDLVDSSTVKNITLMFMPGHGYEPLDSSHKLLPSEPFLSKDQTNECPTSDTMELYVGVSSGDSTSSLIVRGPIQKRDIRVAIFDPHCIVSSLIDTISKGLCLPNDSFSLIHKGGCLSRSDTRYVSEMSPPLSKLMIRLNGNYWSNKDLSEWKTHTEDQLREFEEYVSSSGATKRLITNERLVQLSNMRHELECILATCASYSGSPYQDDPVQDIARQARALEGRITSISQLGR